MDVWSAYSCQEGPGASHIQVGRFQASTRDVSIRATNGSASIDSQEQEVRTFPQQALASWRLS